MSEANLNPAEGLSQTSPKSMANLEKSATVPYLDPEGGYADPEVGRAAELAAMTKWPTMNVNHLPTKLYLDETVIPTVLKALTEVTQARPDNPLEFVAYYILKHNPNRELKTEGTPIGHRHPEDKEGEDENKEQ